MANEKECKLVLTLLNDEDNVSVGNLINVKSVKDHYYMLTISNGNLVINEGYMKSMIHNTINLIGEESARDYVDRIPTQIEVTYSLIDKGIKDSSEPIAKPAVKSGDDDFTDDIPF